MAASNTTASPPGPQDSDPRDAIIAQMGRRMAEMEQMMAAMAAKLSSQEAGASGTTHIPNPTQPPIKPTEPVKPMQPVHQNPPPIYEYHEDEDDEDFDYGRRVRETMDREEDTSVIAVASENLGPLEAELQKLKDLYAKEAAENKAAQAKMLATIEQLVKGKGVKPQPSWKDGYEAAEKANIPHGLVLPHIEKYDGKHDPFIYMRTFVAAMVPLKLGSDTLLQVFPQYLTGAALRWYHQDEVASTKTFDQL